MPYIKLNNAGMKIFYIFHGAGVKDRNNDNQRYAVLIHGAGGNHLSMLSIFNYIKIKFGATYNILVPDLPFHFRSASAAGNPAEINFLMPENDGITFYASTVNLLTSELFEYNKNIVLIGHSMGAQVCIKYASLFPENIEKIMLIAGCHNTGISDSFINSLTNSFDRTIMLFLQDALGSRDKNILNKALADVKRTPAQVVVNDFKYSKYYGYSMNYKKDIDLINSDYGKIFFNIIYSEKDLIIRPECVKELSKKISNSAINSIPAKNHLDFLYGNYYMEKEINKFLK